MVNKRIDVWHQCSQAKNCLDWIHSHLAPIQFCCDGVEWWVSLSRHQLETLRYLKKNTINDKLGPISIFKILTNCDICLWHTSYKRNSRIQSHRFLDKLIGVLQLVDFCRCQVAFLIRKYWVDLIENLFLVLRMHSEQ